MTIKHILVHMEPGTVGRQRLRYALSLADRFGAKLAGLSVLPSPTAAPFAMTSEIYAATAAAAEESCAAAREAFEAEVEGSAVATEWRLGEGPPADVIVAEAARADLVVLGRNDRSDPEGAFYEVEPADVILACCRPVLVVPDQVPAEFRARRILLAWKSAAQAARAAHDALSLLVRADEVVLTEIVPKQAATRYEITADAMADHLSIHGVPVSVRRIAQAGDAGELLIRVAVESECDLIVAGAYGHNRIREWALGGVTQSLLHAGTMPCLMSH